MSYAVKQDPEWLSLEAKANFQKLQDRAKTRRGAIHRHNPPGAKLKKRILKAQLGRRPLRSELAAVVRCGIEFAPKQKQERAS
jgi:hypothetical protein